MNNQKICISKQFTFISIVILLLIAYVLIAFRTMTTGTSTNSRASGTRIQAISPPILPSISPPSCPITCSYIKPFVQSGNNSVQFTSTPTAFTFKKDNIYAVFRYGVEFNNPRFVDTFKAQGDKEVNKFESNTAHVTKRDLSNKFIIFNISTHGDENLGTCVKLPDCKNNKPNSPVIPAK